MCFGFQALLFSLVCFGFEPQSAQKARHHQGQAFFVACFKLVFLCCTSKTRAKNFCSPLPTSTSRWHARLPHAKRKYLIVKVCRLTTTLVKQDRGITCSFKPQRSSNHTHKGKHAQQTNPASLKDCNTIPCKSGITPRGRPFLSNRRTSICSIKQPFLCGLDLWLGDTPNLQTTNGSKVTQGAATPTK